MKSLFVIEKGWDAEDLGDIDCPQFQLNEVVIINNEELFGTYGVVVDREWIDHISALEYKVSFEGKEEWFRGCDLICPNSGVVLRDFAEVLLENQL